MVVMELLQPYQVHQLLMLEVAEEGTKEIPLGVRAAQVVVEMVVDRVRALLLELLTLGVVVAGVVARVVAQQAAQES